MRVMYLAVFLVACDSRIETGTNVRPEPPAKSAQQVADEAKAVADSAFDRDARVYAQMAVHEVLIKERGSSLPEHWKEKGEVLRREDNRAIVVVRTGIKEGMLSEMVVMQSYVLSVEINGDKYKTSDALKCKGDPLPAQIAMLMIKGKWPSAMAKMNGK